jgi:hypothetical protein
MIEMKVSTCVLGGYCCYDHLKRALDVEYSMVRLYYRGIQRFGGVVGWEHGDERRGELLSTYPEHPEQ